MQGLLVAMMNPPADEDAFNAWYDEEHVPLRLGVPGFISARRYRAVNSDGPRYLALYDLASVDVLHSTGYLRLWQEQSDREKAMLASIPFTDRRVGELLLDCPEWMRDAPFQMLVCMTPPAGGEDDFVAWYRDEHIPLLLRVPGWRRVRLFRQVEGNGPAFMAVHELETPDVFDRPEHAAATATPWRKRIRSTVLRYERYLFALWRPMPESVALSSTGAAKLL
jgi:antibiotic biosynthesis monooxygenase (ABM) superfamily enzyme